MIQKHSGFFCVWKGTKKVGMFFEIIRLYLDFKKL